MLLLTSRPWFTTGIGCVGGDPCMIWLHLESFSDVTVGGYSAVWTVVVGFLVRKDNVEESLYLYICINTILCIECIYVLSTYINDSC